MSLDEKPKIIKPVVVSHEKSVAADISQLFNDQHTSDVTILVENRPLYCHKIILSQRSKVFKELIEKDPQTTQIEINGKYDIIFELLKYIYSAQCTITDENFVSLATTANEHGLLPLRSQCLQHLINQIEKDTVIQLLLKAQTGEYAMYGKELVEKCAQVIAEEATDVFNSDDFLQLSEDVLITLLENDFLCIEEIDVWTSVFRWARNHVEKNRDKTLEQVIKNLVPYIRFPLMTNQELLEVVKKHRTYVPEEVYLEALEYKVAPTERTEKRFVPRGGGARVTFPGGKKSMQFSNYNWQCYFSEKPLKSGKTHKWKVKVNSLIPNSNSWGLIIGVATKSQDRYTYLGNSSFGWGYIALNGLKNHMSGSGQAYGQTYGSGDIITVIWDSQKGTLEFHKNGKSQGIAFANVKAPEIYPCICCTTTAMVTYL